MTRSDRAEGHRPKSGRTAARLRVARATRTLSAFTSAAASTLLAACEGPQSALDPAGPSARTIFTLTWILTAIAAAVSVVVIALVLVAIRRRRDPSVGVTPPLRLTPEAERLREMRRAGIKRDPDSEIPPDSLRRTESDPAPLPVMLETTATDRRAMRWLLGLAVAVPLVLIAFSFLYTLVVHRRLALADPQPALTIEVVGRQWWWEVNYLDTDGDTVFTTANEIHIPVGAPVRFRLLGGDVIHSFWVPRLAGKVDMIPGRTNWLTLQADSAGIYRGQCAEYCDGPHAHMSFLMVARSPEEFRGWMNRQARPAGEPDDPLANVGRQVFLSSACAACHAVRGTRARGRLGPDLTHLASRTTLLAAMVPNRRGFLGGLIGAPRSVKPEIHMPAVPLESEELVALIHYLESLD